MSARDATETNPKGDCFSMATKTAAAKAAPKAAPATTTLKQIAAVLAEANEISKKTAEGVLNGLVEEVTKIVKKGGKVRLTGIGMIQVRKRAARTGRNPQTGAPIQIKASKKVAFRAAKELKDAVA
jgi:DNA-binding protein HU-beta